MNQKQRKKNRRTANWLRLAVHTCENCGERGGHWVRSGPMSLAEILGGVTEEAGFWTCAKYYGPDGRRIEP